MGCVGLYSDYKALLVFNSGSMRFAGFSLGHMELMGGSVTAS